MIYGISEYELRETLKATGDTIPSQTKKETAKPSMKWVYRLFHGVQVITLVFPTMVQKLVINLKSVQKKIIKHFGKRAMEIYEVT
jgi:transposase